MERWEIKKSFNAKIIFIIWSLLFLFFSLPGFLYAYDNIAVHPWITEQAFFAWPNDRSHEIWEYLGLGYRDGSNFYDSCATAGDGKLITEGAKEEDNYNPIMSLCTIDIDNPPGIGWYHHFYDPDINSSNNGLCNGVGALAYAYSHDENADTYWKRAKSFYLAGVQAQKIGDVSLERINKGTAYWYLGRIAHLLADVSVPAHVHRDAHVYNKDSYEKYTELHYTNWTYVNAKDLPNTDPSWTVADLFMNLAQRAQYFPSDDNNGNVSNTGDWFDGWPVNPNDMREGILCIEEGSTDICLDNPTWCSINDSNLFKIGDKLMPLAIQYTSQLYELFWREFHVEIEGPDRVESLSTNEFRAIGKIDGNNPSSYKWDFNYDGTFDPDHRYDGQQTVTPDPHYFKGWALKKIALRVNGQEPPIIKEIVVEQYPIKVTLPPGEDSDSLERRFYTPHSDHIEHYTWNFGDESPNVVDDRDKIHPYPEAGCYAATLTLDLDDDTQLTSYTYPCAGSGPWHIQGHTIYDDETWDTGVYVVEGSISVAQGGTLTIEPGTTVKLNNGVSIGVNGTLNATDVHFTWATEGQQWAGIRFEGAGSSGSKLANCNIEHSGYVTCGWISCSYYLEIVRIKDASPQVIGCTITDSDAQSGIYVENGSPVIMNNTISGIRGYWGSATGISIIGNSFPTVTGNTVQGAQNGINVSGDSSGVFQGNTISGNSFGISATYSPGLQLGGNTYANNSDVDLYVSGTITSEITWNEVGALVYKVGPGSLTVADGASLTIPSSKTVIVEGGITVAQGATLTIKPGTEVKLAGGRSINVNGTMKATDVHFTWATDGQQWAGIWFYGADSSGSRLENCNIEHSGYVACNWISCSYYLEIVHIKDSSPTITGCTIADSAVSSGIYVENGSPVITNNTISGLTGYWGSPTGISITSNSFPVVTGNTVQGAQNGINVSGDSGGTYQGNTISGNSFGISATYSPGLQLGGNTYSNNSDVDLYVSGTITSEITWNEVGALVYKVGPGSLTVADGASLTIPSSKTVIVEGGITVAQGATLTIKPGTEVKLAGGRSINVNGSMKATGVTFTWADGQNQWNGIWFEGAGSSGSRLENCKIEHSGFFACGWSSCSYYLEIVHVKDSSPTITGCTISDSGNASYGIHVENGSPLISNNTIKDITGLWSPTTGIYIQGPSTPTVTGNIVSNLGTGINVDPSSGGTFSGNTFSGNTYYGLYYNGSGVLNAINSNWGDPSGPLDDSDDRATGGLYNPTGLGNRVSDHVNYYPWVGSTTPPIPTGLAGTPEDSAINLTWNAVSDPSLDGYKIYYGASSGNYGAPVKVGSVTSHKLTQLTNGTPYYIAISSLNTFGAESAKCTEIMVTPNSDTDKPTSAITQPLNGSNLYTNKCIIKGTADDGTGSGVQKVEVSTDGGATWNPSTGTTSWSYVWTIPGTGTYNIKSRATDNANNEETPGAGITVTVVNRQPTPVTINGRKLMVNGNPFTIKGVGYSPVPIGDDPETTSPYGDYFTSDCISIYDRDLPLLGDMGTNTIRLWSWKNIGDHLDFLDKAYNGGVAPIYVIAGFWINYDMDIDPNAPDNIRENLKADFREMVAIHKNHPAILMWAIGNELNSPSMYGSKLNDLFSLINEMAAEAHQEEGASYHPVTTPLVDSDLAGTISIYDSLVPSLDIWSANVYRGNTFGALFNDYKTLSQKPLAILEYGIDAYDNAHVNEYEKIGTPYQADYTEALWKEIAANSDTCVGGSITSYSDEWYKGEYSTDLGCPDNNAALQSTCGYPTSSHPDGYCNEEWLGIMRTKDNGNNPDVMEPRAVYYRMQSLWVPAPSISVSPASHDFGNIMAGKSSAPQTFTISNTGTGDLVIGTIASTNPSEFKIQNNNCSGHTIAQSSNCTVQVVFSPATGGAKNATLHIPSNDLDKNPLDVPMSGTGINVTLLQPNGGEVIPSGSTYNIKWDASSGVVKFDLQYSMNNGTSWTSIAKKVKGTSYSWAVPTPAANKMNCFVKVIGYNSSNVKLGEDASDNTFTIEVVKVVSPNGGEILRSGTVYTITWKVNGTASPVAKEKLWYMCNGDTDWNLITTRNRSLRSYPWEVPYVSAVRKGCKVMVDILDSGGGSLGKDSSDSGFKIRP